MRTTLICLITLTLAAPAAADWPRFRGPTGDGVSPEKGLPVKWGPDESVVWKVKMPGPGSSSPILHNGRVYVTCYTGHGDGSKGELKDLRRHLLCIDAATGKKLWQSTVAAKLPEVPFGTYIREHGYASSTPVTDGERVYAFFGRGGVYAFDLDGKEVWHAEVGRVLNSWGTAGSPVLYKGFVIVPATIEGSSLYALDRKSGKVAWRVKGLGDSWSTPALVELPGGKTELVHNGQGEVLGIDPDTGERLWEVEGVSTSTASSSPVARGGVVYVMGASLDGGRTVTAVRCGGRGDVNKTHVLWKYKGGTNHTSPILVGDHLYYFSGQVVCLRADTGKQVFQERLYDTRSEYASPVAAGGKLWIFTRRSGGFVLAAKDRLEVLAHNDLKDQSDFNATPAVGGGRLFVRSNAYLYCIGEKR
jgi:outer membrane protein assembly factor BamB